MSVTDGSKHEMMMEDAKKAEMRHAAAMPTIKSASTITPSDDLTDLRVVIKDFIKAIESSPKKSRARSLVITKLEEAEMWAQRATATE
jgi:hypothetical protein